MVDLAHLDSTAMMLDHLADERLVGVFALRLHHVVVHPLFGAP